MKLTKLPLIIYNKTLALLPSKVTNKLVCSMNNLWTGYFQRAEPAMGEQWEKVIWPKIKKFDFDVTLDLAPGAGRNIRKLSLLAKTIYAVDYNDYALELCKKNIGEKLNGCDVIYCKNDGSSLGAISSNSVTTVYCWDSAVHFDKSILRDYIREFERILKPGAFGFVHHSNLGDLAKGDIRKNEGWRSNMTKQLFKEYCDEVGLELISQDELQWGKVTDCISVFKKVVNRAI